MNWNPFSWNTPWFNLPGAAGQVISSTNYNNKKKNFFSFNGKTIYFNLDNEEQFKNAYLVCGPLKSIINKRAQMFINGNVEILNKNTDNKQRGAKAKLLRDILKKPNILQSWKQFFAQFHIYIDIFGYCPVLKIEAAGMPGEISSIWCLPPWLFDVQFTGKWYNQTAIDGIYKSFGIKWNGEIKPLDLKSVCLVLDSSISTDNDGDLFLPDSRIKGHEYDVSNLVAGMKSRNTLITKKGAIGILSNIGKDASGPLKLQKEDKEAVQQDFARYGLTGEEWQVIVTDASLQWQSMSFPTKDLMLFEESDDCKLNLCDALGLYSDLIGAIKKSTFANLNEAKKAQYQDFIIPDANARIEQLNSFLLTDINAYFSVDYSYLEILQQSAKDKADALVSTNTAYQFLYENGLVTKNIWADAAQVPGTPDGDKYIYEVDKTPLAVKLGVGGVQSLQLILASTSMKAEQRKQALIIIFGLDDASATSLAGEDPDPTIDPLTGKKKVIPIVPEPVK